MRCRVRHSPQYARYEETLAHRDSCRLRDHPQPHPIHHGGESLQPSVPRGRARADPDSEGGSHQELNWHQAKYAHGITAIMQMFNVGSTPWSPLGRGLLTRPVTEESLRKKTDMSVSSHRVTRLHILIHTSAPQFPGRIQHPVPAYTHTKVGRMTRKGTSSWYACLLGERRAGSTRSLRREGRQWPRSPWHGYSRSHG